MGSHAGRPRCRRPDPGGAMAWPWGACCVCALSLAGLSHSGRGSQDLKLVSDGWDELLGEQVQGRPGTPGQ